MPGGDGTGPMGLGPMTGRAAGFCAGYPVPGYMSPVPGRGYWGAGPGPGFRGGRGRGGRGRRNWFYATGLPGWVRAAQGLPAWGMQPGAMPNYAGWGAPYAPPMMQYGYGGSPFGGQPAPEQELEALKGQAEYFEDALDGIKKRIQELDTAQQVAQ